MPVQPVQVYAVLGDNPPRADLYYGLNVLDGLRLLPDNSVSMVCTSPPYWALRNYGVDQQVWGGDASCDHDWGQPLDSRKQSGGTGKSTLGPASGGHGISDEGIIRSQERSHAEAGPSAFCLKCNAWKGCLGLEPTPQLYVEHIVGIFREIRRVLHPTGTAWLNLGDSYMSHQAKDTSNIGGFTGDKMRAGDGFDGAVIVGKPKVEGLKDKDLVGIPWRVALALQDDGWWLRNDIIWRKLNAMPHPVRDRFTCKHEHIFLLAKEPRYFFDLDAIRIPHTYGTYDNDGNFTPAQNWFGDEPGERDDRKMDLTEGQLGTQAGPPRRYQRGVFNLAGKNPGDIFSGAEERLDFPPFARETHATTLGIEEFSNTTAFISRVVDQLVDAASRVQSNCPGSDVTVPDETISNAIQEFLSTRPHQPNLSLFRGAPYATITVEQSTDEVSVEFGRNRWILRNESFTGDNTEHRKVIRHRFAINAQRVDALLVLVNWMRGLPFPTSEMDKFNILRREAYRNLLSTPPSSHDTPISNHEAEEICHLRAPGAEVVFAEGMLAVALNAVRISMPKPAFVVEPAPPSDTQRTSTALNRADHIPILHLSADIGNPAGDVWDIATQPYAGAHFAVWPESLAERMVKAGTSEHGVCSACRAPWQRIVNREVPDSMGQNPSKWGDSQALNSSSARTRTRKLGQAYQDQLDKTKLVTVGWEPTCECGAEVVRATVLDPFSGSGTTGKISLQLGRNYIGLDLNGDYLPLAQARITGRKAPKETQPKSDLESELLFLFG